MSATRVICPACGCNLELIPGSPLGEVDCPDCGKRLDLRKLVLPTADPDRPSPAGVDDWAWSPPAAAVSASPSRRPRRRPSWYGPALTVAAVAAVAAIVAVVAYNPPVPPIPSTVAASRPVPATPAGGTPRPDLASMKAAADALASGGHLRAAYDGYDRLLAAAGTPAAGDRATADLVAGARSAQDRVFAALLSGERNGSPAPVAAPVASAHPPPGRSGGVSRHPAAAAPGPSTAPSTEPSTAVVISPADLAPALPGPPPPPFLHAYTLPDVITDAEIGESLDHGIAYLHGRFVNGEIVTGLGQTVGRRGLQSPRRRPGPPVGVPQPPGDPDGPGDLAGGSGLGGLRDDPPPGGGSGRPRSGGSDFEAPWAAAYGTPGIDALAVYALLHAGRATSRSGLGPGEPFTDQILERLKAYRLVYTYHRSLRAAALGTYARDRDRAALEEDVRWLMAASEGGAYTYTAAARSAAGIWDNSNSQYGLLGVWSGAQAGVPVPRDYWRAVARHWTECADPHGTWGYGGSGATLTMTCAGIASLLVSGDYLDTPGPLATTADRPSPNPMADAGLARLDVGDNCVRGLFHPDTVSAMGGVGYGLYGLERVGLASGFKYFGIHDWYAELARRLVNEQQGDGSWGGGSPAQREIDTAYCLLFLARGRHPILYNKLRYDGAWNGHPHDVAHLARFAADQLERPLNWQVVNLRRNWFDWMDSPVLYIAGDAPPALTDHDYDALRDFALGGGMIFTHADGGSTRFSAWVQQMAARCFPKYELTRVPKNHPLYSSLYRLKDPPPLAVVDNGSRILLVHSPSDVAGGWQLNWPDDRKPAFQLGLNVFVYAAGKSDYRNRLASSYIPAVPNDPERLRPVARLRYAGDWDPEPYAWTRFGRYFQWETHDGLDVRTVDLRDLSPGLPLAVLTGTRRQDFTPAEAAAARAYVAAGGVLLVDACGGSASFDRSVRTTLLPAAFPGVPLAPLAANHPLFVASRRHADDLKRLPLRPFAAERLNTKVVPLDGFAFGRGWVVVSHLDWTTGLLGTQSWGVLGYDPAYAQAVVKNAVLWADARSAPPATRPLVR